MKTIFCWNADLNNRSSGVDFESKTIFTILWIQKNDLKKLKYVEMGQRDLQRILIVRSVSSSLYKLIPLNLKNILIYILIFLSIYL